MRIWRAKVKGLAIVNRVKYDPRANSEGMNQV